MTTQCQPPPIEESLTAINVQLSQLLAVQSVTNSRLDHLITQIAEQNTTLTTTLSALITKQTVATANLLTIYLKSGNQQLPTPSPPLPPTSPPPLSTPPPPPPPPSHPTPPLLEGYKQVVAFQHNQLPPPFPPLSPPTLQQPHSPPPSPLQPLSKGSEMVIDENYVNSSQVQKLVDDYGSKLPSLARDVRAKHALEELFAFEEFRLQSGNDPPWSHISTDNLGLEDKAVFKGKSIVTSPVHRPSVNLHGVQDSRQEVQVMAPARYLE